MLPPMPPRTPARIVSLVPSATEMVFRLGAGDELVGRSHVCNHPREASDRPVLTRPRMGARSSRGIHDEIRSLLASGLAIYDIDLDALRALEPTHLLIQDQCSVCAVAPADLAGALAEWLGRRPELITVAPRQLRDVWHDIDVVGHAIGRPAVARALRTELAGRLSALVESIGLISRRPRVACLEWLDPLMIAGHWAPELVRLAGGEPILASTGAASRTIDLETLREARPDVVVVQICGFDLEASQEAWSAQPALWAGLMREGAGRSAPRLFLTDGDAFFNRPGPRLVESAEILAEILHPADRESLHRGLGYREIGV